MLASFFGGGKSEGERNRQVRGEATVQRFLGCRGEEGALEEIASYKRLFLSYSLKCNSIDRSSCFGCICSASSSCYLTGFLPDNVTVLRLDHFFQCGIVHDAWLANS